MQDGFSEFLQHVGSLIRLLQSYVSQKTNISLLSMTTLKSHTMIKFSYLDEYKAFMYNLCMALNSILIWDAATTNRFIST